MRDPSRLFGFYANLAQLHYENCPDLRFLQLIDDFLLDLREQSEEDPFYIEDDKAIELLERYLQRLSARTVVNCEASPLRSPDLSMIPSVERIGLRCAYCGTQKSVKYRFGGHDYCNKCILEVRKV